MLRAIKAYSGRIRQIRAHGYPVETDQFPLIADERQAHSTLLELLLGVGDVSRDHEVLALYQLSALPGRGGDLEVWPNAQVIADGSAGGNSKKLAAPGDPSGGFEADKML